MWNWCFKPLKDCFEGEDDDVLLWDMDLKRHATGDYSMAVIQANSLLEDQGQVYATPSATYVGVYDGHGGPEASRFISNHLFRYIQGFSKELGGLSEEVLRKALDAIEEEFLRMVKRSWLAQPQMASVGSCCLTAAISNGVLFVANLGDSRAVLGRRVTTTDGGVSNSVVAERMSTDHNVGVEEVRKEVEALHPDDSHIVVYTRGVWRIKGIIQVSRSIGDIYLKKPEMNRDPLFLQYGCPVPLRRAVMSAEPSLLTRQLRPEDLFLIFASDGLWEQLSDEEAVDIVVKNPRSGIAKRLAKAALNEAAKKREMKYEEIKRIEKGTRRHYHDDITVIVIYLDQSQGTPNGRVMDRDRDNSNCTTTPVDIFSLNSDQAEDSPSASPSVPIRSF
ncbi:PREDICTED: probable protein phosphatase 2C 63 [Ipomoea nil]|uniref:probable protein phosphatase 2C 63 n=1 Tax=Ipomoea nil TaxID=35883 RepID=UPI000901695B|nr:PREDICTED: probable protein phosphatase 2C 63 [Ipomoea nil]